MHWVLFTGISHLLPVLVSFLTASDECLNVIRLRLPTDNLRIPLPLVKVRENPSSAQSMKELTPSLASVHSSLYQLPPHAKCQESVKRFAF
jgi:hypothetical protein